MIIRIILLYIGAGSLSKEDQKVFDPYETLIPFYTHLKSVLPSLLLYCSQKLTKKSSTVQQ